MTTLTYFVLCDTLLFVLLQEDDAELAKKLAALKWHGKELEVRYMYYMYTVLVSETHL